jgi:hypothetical protein
MVGVDRLRYRVLANGRGGGRLVAGSIYRSGSHRTCISDSSDLESGDGTGAVIRREYCSVLHRNHENQHRPRGIHRFAQPAPATPCRRPFFGEHPNWRALRWGVLSLGGVALVIFFEPEQGTASLGGDLLMVLVVILWTSYLLTSKRARASGVNTIDFMACLMPLGLLTAGPIALIIAGSEIFDLSARGWLVVALLVVMTGMIAHGCIIFAQRFVPVATIGVMQSGQPALAVFWGFLILGEVVVLPQVVGMALVVTGLALFTWSGQRSVPASIPSAPLEE